jgi:general secretion pathway protein D
LFKTHTTDSRKTNMFIFVTPHIIRNPADIAAVTLRKEEELGNVMPQVEEQLHQEINPEHSVKLADIGYEKLSGGQNLAAKEYFMESLEIDPNNPFALINLGVLFEKEQAYPQAIQMYQRVIDTGTYEVARSPEGQEGIDISLVQIARENIVHVKKMMQKQ